MKNAGVDYQQFGQPIVTLSFDAKGARRFSTLTSDYAPGGAKNPSPEGRRYLAIVLDGTLYSAPFIKTAILGGNAIIEGSFTLKEAQDLAIVLRAGSLPAPVKVVEERSVDPTLGQDSIESGKRAAVYGCVAIMVFMIGYYLLSGFVANLALVMNLILLPLGMMAMSGFFSLLDNTGLGGSAISLPTLTLPGIAGIVLTIGMAVDANVLIFERMREEQKLGKKFATVVSAGYEKAFSAIFDSNITTVLAAAIMFWLGSGPDPRIRGHALRRYPRQHVHGDRGHAHGLRPAGEILEHPALENVPVGARDKDRFHQGPLRGDRVFADPHYCVNRALRRAR